MLPEPKIHNSRVPPARRRILPPVVRSIDVLPRSRVATAPIAPAPVGERHLAAIRVTVVDNDSLTRDGITAIVARQHDMLVLEEMPDGGATGGRVQESQPDVVFVDAGLASDNGGAVIRAMLRSSPNAKIIAFGMGTREEEIFHVLNAGASGYVIRNAIGTDLVRAIRSTQAGHRYIPKEIQQRLDARKARPQLTPRERDVLTLLAEARSNATIAAVLGIAVGTVKLHVKSIFAKLGVEDRAEAVLVAMERGFTRMAQSSR